MAKRSSQGIFNICDAAGAEIKGVGIVIEKSFQEVAKDYS